jgi:hypothetical protein
MPDTIDGLFISEILVDNPSQGGFDTDGDGSTNKADEFVEIQNNSGSTVSLDGFEVWSETNGLLYAFTAGDTIAPGDTAVIVGNYSGTPPSGFYDAGLPEGNSSASNFLPDGEGNKSDSIYLVNTNTGEYIVLSYGLPPQTPSPPLGFPGTVQLGSGESINSGAPNGIAFARDGNGTLVETSPPSPGSPNIPCFVAGTLINTPDGPKKIETLKPRDLITTLDHGPRPLRAVRRSRVNALTLLLEPRARPIAFPAAPGFDPLLLSPSHRILVRSADADLLFGSSEVLISAQNALGCDGVCQWHEGALVQVTYYHLLFNDHELICANGHWCESLYMGAVTQTTIADVVGWRTAPDKPLSDIHHTTVARHVLNGYETSVLLRRNKNFFQVLSATA